MLVRIQRVYQSHADPSKPKRTVRCWIYAGIDPFVRSAANHSRQRGEYIRSLQPLPPAGLNQPYRPKKHPPQALPLPPLGISSAPNAESLTRLLTLVPFCDIMCFLHVGGNASYERSILDDVCDAASASRRRGKVATRTQAASSIPAPQTVFGQRSRSQKV